MLIHNLGVLIHNYRLPSNSSPRGWPCDINLGATMGPLLPSLAVVISVRAQVRNCIPRLDVISELYWCTPTFSAR